jgi:plasmid stability protein
MKNITVTLDEDTARRARVRAAERDMSLSRYLGELVRKDIRHSQEYEEAMRRYLSRGPFKELTGSPQRYPTRDELHDRDALRSK